MTVYPDVSIVMPFIPSNLDSSSSAESEGFVQVNPVILKVLVTNLFVLSDVVSLVSMPVFSGLQPATKTISDKTTIIMTVFFMNYLLFHQ